MGGKKTESNRSEIPAGWRWSFLLSSCQLHPILSCCSAPAVRSLHPLRQARDLPGAAGPFFQVTDLTVMERQHGTESLPGTQVALVEKKSPFPLKKRALLLARTCLAAAFRLPGACQEKGHF